LIRYLNPGCYWGLDVTDSFYHIGLDLMDTELIDEKRPNLHVIDPTILARAKAAGPAFVLCNAVVLHVPPEEIAEFFESIAGLLCAQTKAFINVKLSRRPMRLSSRSWAYPESYLTGLVESYGGHVCDVEEDKSKRPKSWRRKASTAWMIITSRPAGRVESA
jgi:hypothetical protein